MLSARSVFAEILDHDDSFRLFASIAAAGEAQGGWENGRIASLLPASRADLAPKVARHGRDEDKHGRIFRGLLRNRGLEPCEVPAELDYTMLLERRGIGMSHRSLRADEPLSDRDVIVYLAHSRVTEQRASEQMALLRKHFAKHPLLGHAVAIIAADEDNHLAYCNEELVRLEAAGFGPLIRAELRSCAHAEIEVYRDVSIAMTRRVGSILGWSRAKRVVLLTGIRCVYAYERAFGWRRMVRLRMPARKGALSAPERAVARSGAGRSVSG